jgi:hypothetical protein
MTRPAIKPTITVEPYPWSLLLNLSMPESPRLSLSKGSELASMIALFPYISSTMLFYLILAASRLTQLMTMLVASSLVFVWLVDLFVIGTPLKLFPGVVCVWFIAVSSPYRILQCIVAFLGLY